MVQRKAVGKFGIQSESTRSHVKSEKRSMSLKPSSQHPDIRGKGGGEIKKKLKKTRSFKLSDWQKSLGSPMGGGQQLQFKRVSLEASKAAATPPKKPTPVKITDGSPNYMKPTSSWDARKESLQVSSHSKTASPVSTTGTDKDGSPRNVNFSKNSSSSCLKPIKKILRRTSSLKPVRPSMKKTSCGVTSHPTPNINRATCSSTLKDSKFPEYVDLHPDGSESEGTSVIKVCPYTYCSLNGHHHPPVPPLKLFMSARRRLLKTQKSMKLKGLSSPRFRSPRGRKKGIDTGQGDVNDDRAAAEADSGSLTVSPITEDMGGDFFVEIYAGRREEIAELVNQHDGGGSHNGDNELKLDFAVTSEGVEEISSAENDVPCEFPESTEIDMEGDGVADSQPYSATSLVDDIDRNSDFPAAEMDVLMSYPDYADYDEHIEVLDTEKLPQLMQVDEADAHCSWFLKSDSAEESKSDELISEAANMDWVEQKNTYSDNVSECLTVNSDGSGSISSILTGNEDLGLHDELQFEADTEVNTPAEISQELYQGDKCSNGEFASGNTDQDGTDLDGERTSECDQLAVMLDMNSEELAPDSSVEVFQSSVLVFEAADTLGYKENTIENLMGDLIEKPTEVSEEKNGNSEADNDFLHEISLLGDVDEHEESIQDDLQMDHAVVIEDQSSGQNYDDIDAEVKPDEPEVLDSVLEGKTSESIDSDLDQESGRSDHQEDQTLLSADVVDAAERAREVGDASGMLEIEVSASHASCFRAGQDMANEDHVVVQTNVAGGGCGSDGKKCSQALLEQSSFAEDLKGRYKRKGRQIIEDQEDERKFNPRAPRFLPLEPDPEAEKVDLRHQMMDDRKTAEEYLLDHALQQAVTKLAPARKKRVSLLVEAFETILPVPKFESHLRHARTSFGHARPIQACS